MNLSLLAAYFAAIFLLIATPEPVVAMVANTAARFGARRALLTALGSNGASLLLIGIAALIITGLFAVDMRMLQWVGLLGCLFIGRMAIVSLYEDLSAQTPDAQPVAPPQKRSAILSGFLVGIANPKDIVFFVAFFPQFIAVTPSIGASLDAADRAVGAGGLRHLAGLYHPAVGNGAAARAAGDLCPVGVAAVGSGGGGSGVCAVGAARLKPHKKRRSGNRTGVYRGV
ncbi:LysE family translocator [Serratia sp. IR-2025]